MIVFGGVLLRAIRGTSEVCAAPLRLKQCQFSRRGVWFNLNVRRYDVRYCYDNCRGDSRIARFIEFPIIFGGRPMVAPTTEK